MRAFPRRHRALPSLRGLAVAIQVFAVLVFFVLRASLGLSGGEL